MRKIWFSSLTFIQYGASSSWRTYVLMPYIAGSAFVSGAYRWMNGNYRFCSSAPMIREKWYSSSYSSSKRSRSLISLRLLKLNASNSCHQEYHAVYTMGRWYLVWQASVRSSEFDRSGLSKRSNTSKSTFSSLISKVSEDMGTLRTWLYKARNVWDNSQ